ncbi:hypothetical protein WMY93_025794 [Mugilogobius chulae]|uniref:EF-hand domain-containing protein n=1 Tax=Mugilogobius chulae TaxID=88201 RepID=A0AAW0N6L8_9GOBI
MVMFPLCAGLGVKQLLNPPKSRAEVERETQEAHELYVHSHNHYFVGERINRKYDLPHFSADSVFGLPTPHHDDGRNVAKTMHWTHLNALTPATNSHLKKLWDFSSSDQYGAGEVIHRTGPGQFAHGPTPQLSLVNAIRNHLKKVNFHYFSSLLLAFSHYDKKGRGLIDLQDLQEVCHEFHIDTNPTVLQDLLHYCDLDDDGHINFLEFANFLCWKDQMPLKKLEQKILTGARGPGACEVGSSLRVPRTLTRTRGDPEAFTQSSALIGAVTDLKAGRGERNCFRQWRQKIALERSCGIPSIRTDLPAPRLKRVSDRTNYGDLSSASALLRPHVYAALGVYEQDFFCPRTKQEIAEIFQNIGLDLSQRLLDEAWDLATMRSPSGDVCVEDFRNILREMKAM